MDLCDMVPWNHDTAFFMKQLEGRKKKNQLDNKNGDEIDSYLFSWDIVGEAIRWGVLLCPSSGMCFCILMISFSLFLKQSLYQLFYVKMSIILIFQFN